MKSRTVHIVGAGGLVGASSAAALLAKPGSWNIHLVDIAAELVSGQALDLNDATAFLADTHVRVGEYKDIRADDIVVITSGIPRRADQSRLDLIGTNAGIMTKVVQSIMAQGQPVFIFVVSNPVDLMTRVAIEVSGLPSERVFGTGTTLDTARLLVAIAGELKVPPSTIDALVLGEHGDSSVAAFEAATVSGQPLTKLPQYSLEWAERITNDIRAHARKIIETKKSTHWGIGAVVANIVEALTLEQGQTFPVGVMASGQYGLSDVVLGLPATVSANGAKILPNYPLTAAEIGALQDSANVLQQTWADYKSAQHSTEKR
jgi:L-lactate dehydrogenase